MSRIETTLAGLANAGRKALVTFITAGDLVVDATVPALRALVQGGADILEIGMPFSDPEAEGPSIQRSSERALAGGVTTRQILDIVQTFRAEDHMTPVLLMGYLNVIERMGYEAFVDAAHEAGVDGLIIVNLPPEEAHPLEAELAKRDMNLILLVAPTTVDERMGLIAARASGFIYYVSLKGVTGAGHLKVDSLPERIALLRSHTRLPIMVGFGIKDGDSARRVSRHADGVVVGSALVDTMARLAGDSSAIAAALTPQLRDIRNALDAGSAV